MKEVDFKEDVLPLKDKLFRLALSITLDRHEAQDIVQDTLLRVWDKRSEWSAIQSIEAYSMTICRNLALDRTRRAANANVPLTDTHMDASDTQPRPDERMLHAERLQLVRHAMKELPELQRTMMVLREVDGLTYQQIAATLDVSEAQVKVYLHRARLKIKNRIEQIENYGL